MIRACGWRDLGSLRRLTARGVCLHSEAVLTTGARVMQKSLVGLFVTRMGAITLVRSGNSDEATAFAQMEVDYEAQRARVCFLAPAVTETPLRVTGALLERLAKEAGNRGARNIVAEAHYSSAEFLELRRAGYVIYARQQVYGLRSLPATPRADVLLEPCDSRDEVAAQRLYSNIVPSLVRRVEPTPTNTDVGYVLRRDGDVVAMLSVNRGPKGVWVEPYVHPEAEDIIGEVLGAFLLRERPDTHKPVYVCVRGYQSWLGGALQSVGFDTRGQQAVMVKRLTAGTRKPTWRPAPAISVTEVEVSAPVTKTSVIEAVATAANGP